MNEWSVHLRSAEEAMDAELRHLRRELGVAHLDLAAAVAALDDARQCIPAADASQIVQPSSNPGAAALARAIDEWRSVVQEPPGTNWSRIGAYIRRIGWSREVVDLDVARQRGSTAYQKNGDFAWCGAFAGACWAESGIRPRARTAELRAKYNRIELMVFSSCYRLVMEWATGTQRAVRPQDVQPGDLVIVGRLPGSSPQARAWGAHICLAAGPVEAGHVPTIEGNARGTGPAGTTYEGVVRQRRPLASANPDVYRVLHVLRPIAEDFA